MQQITVHWSGGIPGCGDALIDGRYAVSVPGSHIETHAGNIPECPGGPGRYLVMGPTGAIAVQGQTDDKAWEYVGGAWHDRGPTFGPNSLIYLLDGTLKRVQNVPEYQATDGYRYVNDAGVPVSCISTYADVARGLYGFTEWLGVVAIGQGGKPAQGAVVLFPDGVLRRFAFGALRASGQLREMRSRIVGDAFVSVVVDYDAHLTTITRGTLAELRALPPVAADLPIVPVSQPPAVPPAQPPTEPSGSMTFPNHLDVVERERAKYGPSLTEADCFAVTLAVAKDPAVSGDGWGLTKAPAGGSGYTVGGVTYRLDKLCHMAGYINDILKDTPGPAGAQWGPNADSNGNASTWAAPFSVAGVPVPVPQPSAPPVSPSDADLSSRVGALEAALAHALDSIEQLEATRATLDELKGLATLDDLRNVARKGDRVTVEGKVSFFGVNRWGGVIDGGAQ